jgi:hypothetical protein
MDGGFEEERGKDFASDMVERERERDLLTKS